MVLDFTKEQKEPMTYVDLTPQYLRKEQPREQEKKAIIVDEAIQKPKKIKVKFRQLGFFTKLIILFSLLINLAVVGVAGFLIRNFLLTGV